MNNSILTLIAVGLSACMSQAIANTTDLILKSNPSYSPDPESEGVWLKSDKGSFALQLLSMRLVDAKVIAKAKKNSCLTIVTKGALTDNAEIKSITKCKKP